MTSEQVYSATSSLADGYHTYTLEWTPDYVSWSFDGVMVRKTEGGQASSLLNAASLRFNAWASTSAGITMRAMRTPEEIRDGNVLPIAWNMLDATNTSPDAT